MTASKSVLLATALTVAMPSALPAQATVEGEVRWNARPASDAVVRLIPVEEMSFSPPSDSAVIDQSHLRFVPRVLAVRVGSVVKFLNSDPIMHNVFSPERQGAGFDLGTYPRGESRTYAFAQPGTYVVLCHVHPEMVAWVVVVPTPYFAVTDRDGDFRIEGVPPGSYRLQTWYRRAEVGEQLIEIVPGQDRLRVRVSGPQSGAQEEQ